MDKQTDESQASAGQVERPVRPQPTNAEDAATGNANAIRHIAYADGYADGVDAERERWMALACDGWRVLQELDERAQRRTSHQNVSDVLDALVRCIRGPNTQLKGAMNPPLPQKAQSRRPRRRARQRTGQLTRKVPTDRPRRAVD